MYIYMYRPMILGFAKQANIGIMLFINQHLCQQSVLNNLINQINKIIFFNKDKGKIDEQLTWLFFVV